MKYSIFGASILFASASLVITTVASAGTLPNLDTECDAPSPELVRLGDQYHDLAPATANSPDDLRMLEHLYQRVQGRWRGELIDTTCFGTGDTSRTQTITYYLENAQASVLEAGLFSIKTDKHLVEKRRGSNRKRSISITPGNRLDFLTGLDLASLEIIDENTVATTARFRQSNRAISSTGARVTTLRERRDRLSLEGNILRIETRHFSNGYFTGTERIVLNRR